MTMDIKNEIKLVHEIITHPSGFDLDIAGILCIRRYEHPLWAVECENNEHKLEVKEFDDPLEAATYFVEFRHKLELGLDFEGNK